MINESPKEQLVRLLDESHDTAAGWYPWNWGHGADAILAAGWTPPPRVFLEGDEIPCHLPVIDNHGEVRDDFQEFDEGDGEVYTANYDVVEMNIDYDAAVAREKARRSGDDPTSIA